jgi:lipopolysaccharide transport system permease protein
MQNFPCTPQEILKSTWQNRTLIRVLIEREVIGRYKGSMFGVLWSFLNPLLMLVVYTFVFSVVFKARWGGSSDSKIEFALILFAGLIIFNLFAECLNRSSGLILSNVNYVKKIVFPLEILSVVCVGTAIFHAVISYGVWLFAYAIFYGIPHITVLLMPLIFIPLIFFMLGMTWIFSSLGVYIRDIPQFAGILTTVVMFLSPIFYPADALPERFQRLLALNPLTYIIETARRALFFGEIPDFREYLLCLLLAFAVLMLGFTWFQKTRKGFADVL